MPRASTRKTIFCVCVIYGLIRDTMRKSNAIVVSFDLFDVPYSGGGYFLVITREFLVITGKILVIKINSCRYYFFLTFTIKVCRNYENFSRETFFSLRENISLLREKL